MFCTNCGNRIDDNSRFCPYCGAQNAPQRQAAPQRQQASSGVVPYRSFDQFIAGTSYMPQMSVLSLIMFFIYGTYHIYSLSTFFGLYTLRFVSFGSWVSVLFPLGITVMFVISFFKKTNRRLFFLIGCAILSLLSIIVIFSRLWFYIVFGILLLACVAAICLYYVFEGRIINDLVKMFACIGLMFFGVLKMLFYAIYIYSPAMFLLYAIPYVALGLGFLFYTPYRRNQM